ncbi:28S ribosomal protein S24, mitochondrial-like [Dreissena polymorpha]|nr:28S ribosomal protein S24, mitochondrial-like [Dreissena polymorpha]
MAALMTLRKLGSFPLTIPYVALRGISTTCTNAATVNKNRLHVRVGRFKPSKDKSIALTYDESKPPYKIGLEKAWNSWNTSNLKGETRMSETLTDDVFIQNFLKGTWGLMQASDVVIKRRHNMIHIFMHILPKRDLQPIYFLLGYSEELLSSLLKCPVKLELQSVQKPRDLIFKYI